MAVDRERYEESVLEPGRLGGNVLPPDLFARYALTPALLRSQAAFAEHVAQVVNYWSTLLQSRRYRPLATALLAAHRELEGGGSIDRSAFERARAADLAAARDTFARRVRAAARTTPCLTTRALGALAEPVRGLLDDNDIRGVVHAERLRVITAWEIPAGPPNPSCHNLRRYVGVLGVGLSVEVVLGDAVRAGFRLRPHFALRTSGATLTPGDVEAARSRLDRERKDERLTAARNVLAILGAQAAVPGGIDALVLWEVVAAVRHRGQGTLPLGVLADLAADLGLDRGEAEELAVSIVEAGAEDRAGGPAREIEDLLARRELRAAQRLLATLPAEDAPELRDRVGAEVAQVADLAATAERERAAGRTEKAAVLLAQAADLAADDEDLRHRLSRLPPPPPSDVSAGGAGDGVAVRWTPSAAQVGAVQYRVARSTGGPRGAEVEEIARTGANAATDPDPPVGELVTYTVSASREPDVWSAAAPADPVLLTPDVSDVEVRADTGSVSCSWRVHPRAKAVHAVRRAGRPPRSTNDGEPVAGARLFGFTDPAVRPGQTYYYRIAAVYEDRTGSRHISTGVIASGRPDVALRPVDDLAVEVLADRDPPMLRATWTAPAPDAVTVVVAAAAPPWPAGTPLPAAELARHGRPAAGQVRPSTATTMELVFPAVHGRCHVTAVSVAGTQAVIGTTVSVTVTDPVSGLRADRFDDLVRLSWLWPPGSGSARVTWCTPGRPDGELLCTRRSYEDDGGVELAVGPEPARITVRTVVRDGGEEIVSAPVEVQVPRRPLPVYYRIRRRRRHGATVVLTCAGRCTVPPMVVVHSAGPVMPLRAEQGTVIQRVPAQELQPDTPVMIDVAVPRTRGESRLACFIEDGRPGDVTLVPDPSAPAGG